MRVVYDDDDTPNIGLKLSFDKINPEFYNFMYLISILAITTTVLVSLYIIDLLITLTIRIYKYLYKMYNRYNDYIEYTDTIDM